MKRKEKEGNERMPGILRLTEIPREEPLRARSKIRRVEMRRDTAEASSTPFALEMDITHSNTSILT